jgi:hypothetical protein
MNAPCYVMRDGKIVDVSPLKNLPLSNQHKPSPVRTWFHTINSVCLLSVLSRELNRSVQALFSFLKSMRRFTRISI